MGTLALPCRTTRGEATASHAAVFWLPWNKSGNLASLLESWAAVPAAARWDPVLHLANPRYVMFTHTIQFHAAPPWLSQDRGPAAPNNAPLWGSLPSRQVLQWKAGAGVLWSTLLVALSSPCTHTPSSLGAHLTGGGAQGERQVQEVIMEQLACWEYSPNHYQSASPRINIDVLYMHMHIYIYICKRLPNLSSPSVFVVGLVPLRSPQSHSCSASSFSRAHRFSC